MSNRKLIRPSLSDLKERMAPRPRRKPPQTDQTNAENFFYAKQIQNRTPMVLVLADGEKVQGIIEWYDKHSLRLQRRSAPHLLVPKRSIKYMFKAQEQA